MNKNVTCTDLISELQKAFKIYLATVNFIMFTSFNSLKNHVLFINFIPLINYFKTDVSYREEMLGIIFLKVIIITKLQRCFVFFTITSVKS